MTVAAIRERLYDYIKIADDKKVEAIYNLLEDQMTPASEWSEDEEFIAELNDRVKRWEDGIDILISLDEHKAEIEKLDSARLKNAIK